MVRFGSIQVDPPHFLPSDLPFLVDIEGKADCTPDINHF